MRRAGLSVFVALVFALIFGAGSSSVASAADPMDMDGSHMGMNGSHMDGDHNKMDCPYCKMMAPHMKEHINTLREAAEALKATHPDLSKKLSEMADMKESMMMKVKEDMDGEMKSQKMEHMPEGSH